MPHKEVHNYCYRESKLVETDTKFAKIPQIKPENTRIKFITA